MIIPLSSTHIILPDVEIVVGEIRLNQGPLFPEEEEYIRTVTAARMREYRAGRTLARDGMKRLGLAPASILSRADGSPVFPKEVCGSIAHTTIAAAAVISKSRQIRAVGLDIVDRRSLGVASGTVATAAELNQLAEHYSADLETAARLAFSAKEAIFKCQAPVTGYLELEFLDVLLVPALPTALRATPSPIVPPMVGSAVSIIEVKILEIQGVVVALATLAKSEAPTV